MDVSIKIRQLMSITTEVVLTFELQRLSLHRRLYLHIQVCPVTVRGILSLLALTQPSDKVE